MGDTPAVNEDVLNALAAKLDTLDLTDAEQQVVDTIMERATAYEPEVEGFGFDHTEFNASSLSSSAMRLGSAFGGFRPPPPEFRASPPMEFRAP